MLALSDSTAQPRSQMTADRITITYARSLRPIMGHPLGEKARPRRGDEPRPGPAPLRPSGGPADPAELVSGRDQLGILGHVLPVAVLVAGA